jgi:N-methylhydantoinase A
VAIATLPHEAPALHLAHHRTATTPARTQLVRDTVTGEVAAWPVYDRTTLHPGASVRGPAIIAEDETSTLVGPHWSAWINALGYIELVQGTA